MGGGKALRMGTGHGLDQNSARAFDIRCLPKDGEREPVRQTFRGVSPGWSGA